MDRCNMDAKTFYREFVRKTNENNIWYGEIGKARTYREIYKTDETAFTELVNKHIIHEIVAQAGYEPQHEYFRIDTIGWKDAGYRNMQDAQRLGLNRHLWNLMIAVEHENDKADWMDEVIKLMHIKCPLKVVIGYNHCDMRETTEPEKLAFAAKWMKELAVYDKNANEEFLLIFGNAAAKENTALDYDTFDYRGYLYDCNLETFIRIE